ncbi:amidase signature enzyme [Crepidotus variabilis]|uniref:amidase n=1 Tax=Crepidotus variabilis TaxID=179855 RepID=A0A9P6EA20_9AGAR|nr:amidase signature enzyme [Crepidotus variabilis]
MFSWLAHRRACATKQDERQKRIKALPAIVHDSINEQDKQILRQNIGILISNVHSRKLDPTDILNAYAKKALKAHGETNCLTEVFIADAFSWAKNCNKDGPLAGVPVSLKDTVGCQGYDSCAGYSAWVGKPSQNDSALVRLLRDAGAVPFVKTNIPITLLSFESSNDVFGRTTNPHKKAYSPGGSSGGEAALLAYGGSRIGIGSDVAGSVRVPSHYSGVYTVKASVGRFPRAGCASTAPGQEGVAAVYSPMARTLEDLEVFWKAIVSMKPWKYDVSCLPIPWRDVKFEGQPLKWGVIWDDGAVAPSPACTRALRNTVDILQANGHHVVDIKPPKPYEGLRIGSALILADGGKTFTKPIRAFETNDPGVAYSFRVFGLPSFLRKLYAFYVRYIKGDEIFAGLLDTWHAKDVQHFWRLVAEKEAYKQQWFEFWQEQELDFVLTVPNALPAVPHNGMKEGFAACGYTFLWNVLDYSAGVLPVTHVDRTLDKLDQKAFRPRNCIEADFIRHYNAIEMDGLPVGVQVIGQRLEEEKVLSGMRLIEGLLKDAGCEYKKIDV